MSTETHGPDKPDKPDKPGMTGATGATGAPGEVDTSAHAAAAAAAVSAAAAAAAEATMAAMSTMMERRSPRRRRRWLLFKPLLIGAIGAAALVAYQSDQIQAPTIRIKPLIGAPVVPEKPMKVYKWADAEGALHYSNSPPLKKGQNYETMEVVVRNPVRSAGGEDEEGKNSFGLIGRGGSTQTVGNTIGPVLDAYRQAPQAVDRTREVAQQLDQRMQNTQKILDQIHP